MIIGILNLVLGVVAWMTPQFIIGEQNFIGDPSRPHRILRGQRKQVIAWGLMLSSLPAIFFQSNAFAGIALAMLIILGVLWQERIGLSESEPQPTVPRNTSQKAPPPRRTPNSLTPELHETLAELVKHDGMTFDTRRIPMRGQYQPELTDVQINLRDRMEACEVLHKMGYLSAKETGPGGCIQIFKPLAKASKAVAKEQSDQ